MNNEFQRMQQLAGINEIRIVPGEGYAEILDKYIKDIAIPQEEDYQDDYEAAEYFYLLKSNPPKAYSAEKVAEEINNIDNTLTRLSGAYLGDFYYEAVVLPLVDMGKKTSSLRPSIRRVIEILHGLYDIDNESKENYNKYISDEWKQF